MRRSGFCAALVLAGGAVAALAAEGGPQPLTLGGTIPLADQKMKNVDGREISIAEVQGAKGTLVVFTCNACPFAKAWEDRIVALGNKFHSHGVGVIAINSNDPGKNADDGYEPMQARAKEKGFGFPYVVDATSGVARAFGASRTPEAFVFDAGGKLVYHGTIDDNSQAPDKVQQRYLESALDAVVAGKEVAVKETKALGCGIKFRG
ncbi:MAG TPA: thioredoxin family protein [Candidatus Polarisedimenticolaceae bacterium]|nr:thioredoxin family protein [Candidatus Polarisedimenticolaceae bacterium]